MRQIINRFRMRIGQAQEGLAMALGKVLRRDQLALACRPETGKRLCRLWIRIHRVQAALEHVRGELVRR